MRSARAPRRNVAAITSGIFCRELIGRASELSFLQALSEQASHITLHALTVDGGAALGV